MPARQAEEWAIRLACAVIGAGVTVPDNMMMAIGAAVAPAPAEDNSEARELYERDGQRYGRTFAQWGITSLAKVPFAQSKPLLDELLGCVKFLGGNGIETALVDEGQIEEISTWSRLKIEAFNSISLLLQPPQVRNTPIRSGRFRSRLHTDTRTYRALLPR